MCWWKVHSNCRKCTVFLHILRLICFVREKWLKEFLRELTVHSECYIIWWEKWQRRQRLRTHFSSAFIIMGTIYLFILPHLLTLFPVLILVVIFFSFMHLDINKLKYSILCLFFYFFVYMFTLNIEFLTTNDNIYLDYRDLFIS